MPRPLGLVPERLAAHRERPRLSRLLRLDTLVRFGVFGVVTLRWLWAHLSAGDRPPVVAYILVIVVMCAVATGSSSAVGSVVPVLGAACFMASDVAVARDRFVLRSVANRLWGLPLYYFAQLLLAWTVTLAG